jgi:hypothetical protein
LVFILSLWCCCRATIDVFKRSLYASGCCRLKGDVVLSFYEKKEVKGFLGLYADRTESLCLERWRLSIILVNSSSTGGIAIPSYSTAENAEALLAYRSAYDQVTIAMMSILEVLRFLFLFFFALGNSFHLNSFFNFNCTLL